MPRAKRSLADTDGNARPASSDASQKTNKKRKSADGTAASVSTEARTESSSSSSPLDWNFVARCRPREDEKREKRSNGDNSSEEEEEDLTQPNENREIEHDEHGNTIIIDKTPCYCDEPLSKRLKEHPGWIWCMTERGSRLYDEYVRSLYTRRPDDFDMYIYNDFEAYAMIEVQENMLQAFQDAHKSRKMGTEEKLREMWAVLEAAGFWLTKPDTGAWVMADDSDKVGALMGLWGSAVLTMCKELIDARMFGAGDGAPVPNLRLVLSLFVLFMTEMWCGTIGYGGLDGETLWVSELLSVAEDDGKFELTGAAAGLDEEDLGKFPGDDEEEEEGLTKAQKWKKWDFAKHYKDYLKEHGRGSKIGGNEFDIAAMPAAQRKQHHFDKKDPLKDAKNVLPPKDMKMCTV